MYFFDPLRRPLRDADPGARERFGWCPDDRDFRDLCRRARGYCGSGPHEPRDDLG